LINRWSKLNIIPGNGFTAMPYLHIDDFIALVEKIIDADINNKLSQNETFMASHNISINHNQIFPIIRKELNLNDVKFYIPKKLVSLGLDFEYIMSKLLNISQPQEQKWMLEYIDMPIIVNSTYTQNLLDWNPNINLIDKLPHILSLYKHNRTEWNLRQNNRMNHNYQYVV